MHVAASSIGQALHSGMYVNQTCSALSTSNAEYTFSISCDQQHIAYCRALLNAHSVCWKVYPDQAGVTLLQSCGQG